MTTVRVTVDDETFAVEVEDLRARPVVVRVEGQRFEVWPEAGGAASHASPAAVPAPAGVTAAAACSAAPPAAPGAAVVTAPIPGVVVEVSVQPGDTVSAGQPLLAIEAMKMKNVIRATRAGAVAHVHVAVGQTVRHREALLDYV
jgi:biotin carboxyl carrier protein